MRHRRRRPDAPMENDLRRIGIEHTGLTTLRCRAPRAGSPSSRRPSRVKWPGGSKKALIRCPKTRLSWTLEAVREGRPQVKKGPIAQARSRALPGTCLEAALQGGESAKAWGQVLDSSQRFTVIAEMTRGETRLETGSASVCNEIGRTRPSRHPARSAWRTVTATRSFAPEALHLAVAGARSTGIAATVPARPAHVAGGARCSMPTPA